jgi:excisionase family DNA binding protein
LDNKELYITERIAAHDGALSAPKLSKLLGLNRSTLYRMADEGRIPSIRIGNTLRFDPKRTADWLRSKEIAA